MATYTISTAVTTTAIAQSINTGDTVTVTSSGSLYSTAHTGIYSSTSGGAHGGFDTLNISGTVRGYNYGFYDAGTAGNDVITVSSTGHIYGDNATAVYVSGGSNTVTNDGTIVSNGASDYGIYFDAGGNDITNTGSILSNNAGADSAIDIYGGYNTITNSGTIASVDDYAIYLSGTGLDEGHNVVSNSGMITGDYGIKAYYGSNSVTNTGTIATSYTGIELTGAHNTVNNSGSITAGEDTGVDLDGAHSSLTNSGLIASGTDDYGVSTYGSHNVIVNKAAGTIANTYTGTGIYGSGASLTIKNAGVVSGGEDGIDVYDVTGAHIKVTGSGSVIGGTDTGIYAYGHDTSGVGTNSDVHINVKGLVQGGEYGIGMYYDNNVIKVGAHGSVVGVTGSGIYVDSGNNTHIFNAGLIQAGSDDALYLDGASNHIHNTGTIISAGDDVMDLSGGNNFITNKGTMISVDTGIDISGGTNVVNNLSGGLLKVAATNDGNDAIYMDGGSNQVTNSGKIQIAVHGYTDVAGIYAASGTNVIVNNHGGVITDFHGGQTTNFAVQLEDGNNVVTNSGKIVGAVQIGSTGTNTYDGSGGHLKGTVIGGDGSDTIVLGGGHSSVVGGSGADVITAGSGSDNFVYTAVTDSDITAYDTVDGFKAGTDHFTFDLGAHAFTGLASVTVSSLSGVSDGDIATAVAGHLDPYGAVALSVSSGLYAGDVFLVVDANGDSVFDNGGATANQDYLVVLTHLSGTLSASDILTT